MSKTDKTIPYRVAEMLYGFETHNHDNGICELIGRDRTKPHDCKTYTWRACDYGLTSGRWGDKFGAPYKWERPAVVSDYARRGNRRIRHSDRQMLRQIINNDRDYDETNFGRFRRNAEWLAY